MTSAPAPQFAMSHRTAGSREFHDFDKDNDFLHEHACFFFKLEEDLYAIKIFNDPLILRRPQGL
jgi:hypothetical protein